MPGDTRSSRGDRRSSGLRRAFPSAVIRVHPIRIISFGIELRQFCDLMSGDPYVADRAMGNLTLTTWQERGLVPGSSIRMWLYRIAIRSWLDDAGCQR